MVAYHREDKSLVVVSVLPYQVDSSRSTHRYQRSLVTEHLAIHAASLRNKLGNSWKWTGHGGMLAK